MIKVRFNLGRGERYMKWKIQYSDKSVEYLDPETTQLIMKGCRLVNNPKVARKIFDGNHKVVCAWVLCDEIQKKRKPVFSKNIKRIYYNPKIKPNWVYRNKNVDGSEFETLFTIGRSVYKK